MLFVSIRRISPEREDLKGKFVTFVNQGSPKPTRMETTSSALIRRLNDMLVLKKLLLANHALIGKFNEQMNKLWAKVRRGVTDFLSPE